MKINALVPMWGRPEVVKMFLYYFNRHAPTYAELTMTPVLSEDDPHFNALRRLVKDYPYLVYQNLPLGSKKNAGLMHMFNSEWDYMMDLGSDDIFSPFLWDVYREHFGKEMFGLMNLYIYDIHARKAIFLRKYANKSDNETFGACRMIRRDVCERLWPLWEAWDSGLDGCSRHKIISNGVEETVINSDRACLVVDLKTNTNIHHFMLLEDMGEAVDADWLEEQFGICGECLDEPKVYEYITFNGFHSEVCRRSVNMTKQEAFNQVNAEYAVTFGVPRYKNYSSYTSQVTQKHGKRNNSV